MPTTTTPMPTTTTPMPTTPMPTTTTPPSKTLLLAVSNYGRIAVKTSYTSEWDFEKIPSSNVKQVTQLLDGSIVAVTKDGKIGCKTSYASDWDYKKLESTSIISYITQLFDGTIVAVTGDGKIACKTSYTSEWDFNKLLSPGNVNHLVQFQDGTIVAVTNDGKIACKTSYDSEWDFNKIKTSFPIDDYRKIAKNLLLQGQQTLPKTFTFTKIGQIIQLQDGTIVINNAVGKFDIAGYTVYYINAAKTTYNSEWDFENDYKVTV